eukprot:398118_1
MVIPGEIPDSEERKVSPDGSVSPEPGVPEIRQVACADESKKPDLDEKDGEKSDRGDSGMVCQTWLIPNFGEIPESRQKMYSDEFDFNGIAFRLLLFPHGNRYLNYISAYVQIPESEFAKHPAGWRLEVRFKIVVKNREKSKSKMHAHHHIFNSTENDRGYDRIIIRSEILEPDSGFLDADGSLTVVTGVEVVFSEDPPPWNVDLNYNSKKETGLVGLKNQGATCYMNSFLQTLYHISYFRKAVFSVPTLVAMCRESKRARVRERTSDDSSEEEQEEETDDENESEGDSIALALQKLFYELQTSTKPVATKSLTHAFGWSQHEQFEQHDVQEFSRILCEVLELKMKTVDEECAITKLFEGKFENFIECINVDYRSAHQETFQDLSLTVKGLGSVEASLDEFVARETLSGENQYHSDEHGPQDAHKGIRFLQFPPVLQLQLKRFDYPAESGHPTKINDRFEFPAELDLSKYMRSEPATNKPSVNSNGIPQNSDNTTHNESSTPVEQTELISDDTIAVHATVSKLVGDCVANHTSNSMMESDLESQKIVIDGNVESVTRHSSTDTDLESMIQNQESGIPKLKAEPSRMDVLMAVTEAEGHNHSPEIKTKCDNQNQDKVIYSLHSVLVHSGSVYGGHYEVFIRPDCKTHWYRFDDDQVVKCGSEHAVDGNFGGIDKRFTSYNGKDSRIQKQSSAYMLVYIKKSMIPSILPEASAKDIPAKLVSYFEAEKKMLEQARLRREDDKKKMRIRVTTINSLTHCPTTSTELFDRTISPVWKEFRVYKLNTLEEFKVAVQEKFNIAADRQQYWFLTKRRNNTIRTNRKVSDEQMREPIEKLPTKHFYVHVISSPYTDEQFARDYKLIFLKWFDVNNQNLRVLSGEILHRDDLLSNVIKQFRKAYTISEEMLISVVEEENASEGVINVIDPTRTVADHQLVSGDILCFSIVFDSGDWHSLIREFHNPTKAPLMLCGEGMLQLLGTMIQVEFRPRDSTASRALICSVESAIARIPGSDSEKEAGLIPGIPGAIPEFDMGYQTRVMRFGVAKVHKSTFTLTLSKHTKLQSLLLLLGDMFFIDPGRLELFRVEPPERFGMSRYTEPPHPDQFALDLKADETLESMVKTRPLIFFSILPYTRAEMNDNYQISYFWKEEHELAATHRNLLLERYLSIRDFVGQACADLVEEKLISDTDSPRLRLYRVVEGSFHEKVAINEHTAEEIDSDTPSSGRLVLDLAPERDEEPELPPSSDSLEVDGVVEVWISQGYRGQHGEMKRDGFPFSITVRPSELLLDVKERIRKRFRLTEPIRLFFDNVLLENDEISMADITPDWAVSASRFRGLVLERKFSKKRKNRDRNSSLEQRTLKIRK